MQKRSRSSIVRTIRMDVAIFEALACLLAEVDYCTVTVTVAVVRPNSLVA
jgi:hypothetical protein